MPPVLHTGMGSHPTKRCWYLRASFADFAEHHAISCCRAGDHLTSMVIQMVLESWKGGALACLEIPRVMENHSGASVFESALTMLIATITGLDRVALG